MADIEMPQLGETVTEGTIITWFKAVGDEVAMDEVLFEVSTDKVDSEVPSPAAGYLSEILVAEGETVDVGTRLAVLADAPPSTAAVSSDAPPATSVEAEGASGADAPTGVVPSPDPEPAAPPAEAAPAPPVEAAPAASPRLLSPLVRRLVDQHGIDIATIQGTGVGGRVTRRDVESVIEAGRVGGGPAVPPTAPAPAAPPAPPAAPVVLAGADGRDLVVPLSNIRRRTGEHMVASVATSPHALTAVEVDFEGVDRVRRAHRDEFAAEQGFSLTYLPFVSRALIDALADYPHLNATVGDGELIVHGRVNLAVAVDLDFQGLLAPVVHDAETKRLTALAREVHDLADRARKKALSADDIAGGTFTVTNAGRYGTLMQFPIINQPQVAILSTDGVRRRPVVVTDAEGGESIAIHSVGVLAVAWDHRAFDGAYVAAFLDRLREIIETRDWSAEL